MPGPWVTEQQVLDAIAARINKYATSDPRDADLEAYWDNVASEVMGAIAQATQDITVAMASKGYSAAQVDSCDQRVPWSITQSLFWAFTNAGVGASYDDKFIEKLDLREYMKDAILTAQGDPILPEQPNGFGTGVSSGIISAAGDFGGATSRTQAGGFGVVTDNADRVKDRWARYRRNYP